VFVLQRAEEPLDYAIGLWAPFPTGSPVGRPYCRGAEDRTHPLPPRGSGRHGRAGVQAGDAAYEDAGRGRRPRLCVVGRPAVTGGVALFEVAAIPFEGAANSPGITCRRLPKPNRSRSRSSTTFPLWLPTEPERAAHRRPRDNDVGKAIGIAALRQRDAFAGSATHVSAAFLEYRDAPSGSWASSAPLHAIPSRRIEQSPAWRR
jgi:hypothetical protein